MTLNAVIERLERNESYLRENWSLPTEAARFLYLLARIGRFQRLLEIGTSVGYSTLHLAQAAAQTGGTVTTIDAAPERQQQAVRHLQEANLAQLVNALEGDALTVLRQLETEGRQFDFMFVDARKSEYKDYLALAEKLLVPGGVLLADNTRSHRDEMMDFIEAVTRSAQWDCSDLDTSNGFVLARKKDAPSA